MKLLTLVPVFTIAIFSLACPAGAVIIPDQVQPDWATNQYSSGSLFNWQEEVTAGVSGKLMTVQLWSGQTTTGSFNINVGGGWQTDANNFTGTITGVGGTNWSSVDVSSANINLNVGDKFTIEFNGNNVMGVWGSFHNAFSDYPRGSLYTNAAVGSPNQHFAFRTFMDVAPGPVPFDVIQSITNLGFSSGSAFTWQQEVTALTTGTLKGFDLWTSQANSGSVFINLGSGWQTDANAFTGTISGTSEGWSHVDVSAANIGVTAGQKFVIGFNGNNVVGLEGSQLNGDQYSQGRLFVNGSEQANVDLGFRTYVAVNVPEPSTGVLAVLACGLIWWWRKRSPFMASQIDHGASIRLRRLMAFVAALLLIPAQIAWATPITLGVMGDSLSDEYSEQTYGTYSQSWTQQVVQYRGIDLGPTAAAAGQPGGTWGEPRRTGYEYNWARYGDTTGDLLAAGQPTGLAGQIAPKGINYAVLMIGSNDQLFDGNNAYQNIYSGAWSSAQINTWANGVASNIATALNTVAPTGVKMVLVNTADYGVAPYVNTVLSNAAGRQAVSNALHTVLSPKIEALAASQHLPFVDLLGALEAIYGPQTSLHSTLSIGNVAIQLQSLDSGANPTAGFVGDGIHPNTTIQGILANLVLDALDIGYGANLSLFSEQEILAHKGLTYGGADTLTAQIGPYSAYVSNYVVPEPSTFVLGLLSLAALCVLARRRVHW